MSPPPSEQAAEAGFARAAKNGVVVAVVVTPGARGDAVVGVRDDGRGGSRLAVKVSAPPDRGRANEAVAALLARAWGLPQSAVAVARGHADRRKAVFVQGDPDVLMARIAVSGKSGRNVA